MLDTDSRVALEAQIRKAVHDRFGDHEAKILLPPPPTGKVRGSIGLGQVVYGRHKSPFGLRPAELLQGLGIYGRSGSGKTNIVLGLLGELERHRIPFLFLDWKQTCRHFLPNLKSRVNFYTPGKSIAPFAFNPLIPPPGIETRTHVAQVVDILSAAYMLGEGAKSVLQKAIRGAFVDSQSQPSLVDVKERIESEQHSGRAIGWRASALRALESLLLVSRDDEPDQDPGSLVDRMMRSSSVVELDGLNDSAKKFLVPALMMWIFRHRLSEPDRERLRLVVIVEEAHHLLFRSENRSEESIM